MKYIFSKLNLCWIVFTTIVLTIITLLMQGNVISAYYQATLFTIGINIILAVSLNLIIGITGQFSLGHAGFMCIGAYSCAVITLRNPTMFGFLLGVLVGAIISSLVALVVAIPTLRLKGDYLAIATLGFSEIVRIVVLNMKVTNGAAGLFGIPKLTTWPLLVVCVIVSILIVLNFSRSAPGRACISIREDEIASEAMGINTTKYKTIAFVIGAVLASLAGALYASNFYVIKPDLFTWAKSVDVLIFVVFGGMGSYTGSILSAIVIGFINMFLQSFSDIRMILYGAALVLIMVFRPKGLLGTKEFTLSGLFKTIENKKKEVLKNESTKG